MDGDSRGGAALSVKAVSGKPIKFVGTGETLEALEPFYPDRTASRILGASRSLAKLSLRLKIKATDLPHFMSCGVTYGPNLYSLRLLQSR
jgi:hypothetical protein